MFFSVDKIFFQVIRKGWKRWQTLSANYFNEFQVAFDHRKSRRRENIVGDAI